MINRPKNIRLLDLVVLSVGSVGVLHLSGCAPRTSDVQALAGSSSIGQSDAAARKQAAFSIVNGPTALNITTSSANIQWTLSTYGTGQVEYGLTTSYGSFSAAETSFNYQTHLQTLSNLQVGTAYHYRVISKNSAGQQVVSADQTFTTLSPVSSPSPATSQGVVTITSPSNGAAVSGSVTVSAAVDSTTCNGGLNHMEVLVNGTLTYSVSACSLSTSVSVPSGSSTILVRAIRWDNALMGQASVMVSSSAPAPSPSPSPSPSPAPSQGVVTITSPSNGAAVSGSATVSAAVDSTTCNGGLNHMEVLVNGTSAYSVSACSLSTSVSVPSGSSTILVRAIRWDNALMGQASVTVNSSSPAPSPSPSPSPTPTPTSSGCPSGSTVMTGGSISTGISNTPAGGTLCLNGGSYSVSSKISISKAITILGVNQPQITQSVDGVLFEVAASNVTIKGLSMTGASRNWGNNSCTGTVAVWADAVNNLTLANNYVTTFTCGYVLDGTDGFSVTGNEVHYVKYASMTASAASNGTFDSNKIYDVNHDGPLGQNGYGITATGNRSHNITISNNLVQNAPTWECYDTHDGDSISFLNNVCIAPGRVGINAAYSGVAQVTNIRIEGNTINAGGLTSQWNSIVLTGSGTLMNNTVTGFNGCLFYSPNVTPSGNTCN